MISQLFWVNSKSNGWYPFKKAEGDLEHRHGETEGKSYEYRGRDWSDAFISQRLSRIVKTTRN